MSISFDPESQHHAKHSGNTRHRASNKRARLFIIKTPPPNSMRLFGSKRVATGPQTAEVVSIPPAFEYIRRQLSSLEKSGRTSRLAAIRALREIRPVLAGDSVYPHISADENGEVTMYWLAGTSRLTISVPEQGNIYFRATSPDSQLSFEGFRPTLPKAETRRFISHASRLTRKDNPDWRQVFDS